MLNKLFDIEKYQTAVISDKDISFNINRSNSNYSNFARKVVIMPSLQHQSTVIPGANTINERKLLNELATFQRKGVVNKYSFKISPLLFSFLWRFRIKTSSIFTNCRSVEPLEKPSDTKITKKINNAYKKYQTYLKHNLASGQIFLIPDREVMFNQVKRVTKIYARRILIFAVQSNQITFIPFTTQVNRQNKTDILFDKQYKGACLDSETFPAVETFPYNIFTKKTLLKVNAAQPVLKKEFFEFALMPIGTVRKEVLNFIQK